MYRPVVNKSARYLRATEACSDTNWSRNTHVGVMAVRKLLQLQLKFLNQK